MIILAEELANFFCKGPENIYGFVGHIASCNYSAIVAWRQP